MKPFLTPLTEQEEQKYLMQWTKGDKKAKETLIEHNMRLVAHIARKYQNTSEDMEELISIGTIGLIKAVNTYKPDKECRLGTYAAKCIENELLMHFRSKKKLAREVSLFEPIGTDKEGNQIKLVDVVESDLPELWEQIELHKSIKKIYELVPNVLDDREQLIICKRYGLYNTKPLPQREIADELGISRSYVSRIEKKALQKLRNAF